MSSTGILVALAGVTAGGLVIGLGRRGRVAEAATGAPIPDGAGGVAKNLDPSAGTGVGYLPSISIAQAAASSPSSRTRETATPATPAHPHAPGTLGKGGTVGNTPTLESWRPYYEQFGADVPTEIAMKWTEIESDGNPCGVGTIPAAGHQPQEYGLAQLNGQDPANLAIATPQSLRGACGSGPGAQMCLRALTEDERVANATAALGLMRLCATKAASLMGAAPGLVTQTAGALGWSAADFWRLAKTYHAAPAVADLFPAVHKNLGTMPTWAQFRQHANAALLPKYGQKFLDRVWSNAERTGGVLGATGAPNV